MMYPQYPSVWNLRVSFDSPFLSPLAPSLESQGCHLINSNNNNSNDNNVYLSCAHQRPERSHDAY